MPIIVRTGGGGDSLRLKIRGYAELPAEGDKNEIAIITETEIPHYALAAENPFLETIGGDDLLAGLETKAGYFGSNGSVSTQDGTNKEVYTEAYIPVEYGKSYTVKYSISASKSMWLAVCEYNGSTFVQRIIAINATGTEKTYEYTPSAETVTAVRLSWRTYGLETTVTFINPIEFVTKDDVDEGTVWIKVGASSPVAIWVDAEETVKTYPISAAQFVNGTWSPVTAKTYLDGEWEPWRLMLYGRGVEYVPWAISVAVRGQKEADHLAMVWESSGAGSCYIYTDEMVDLTNVKTLCIVFTKKNSSSLTLEVAEGQTTGTVIASVKPDVATTETLATLDVSAITGSYYIRLYSGLNSAGSCDSKTYDVWGEY